MSKLRENEMAYHLADHLKGQILPGHGRHARHKVVRLEGPAHNIKGRHIQCCGSKYIEFGSGA